MHVLHLLFVADTRFIVPTLVHCAVSTLPVVQGNGAAGAIAHIEGLIGRVFVTVKVVAVMTDKFKQSHCDAEQQLKFHFQGNPLTVCLATKEKNRSVTLKPSLCALHGNEKTMKSTN